MLNSLAFVLVAAATAHRFATGLARCGPLNRFKCPESDPCCSKWGYCGAVEHCAPGICIAGCPKHVKGDDEPAAVRLASEMHIDDNAIVPYELIPKLGMPNVHCACKNPKHAALTYDDGVDPKYTPQILDILAAKKAPATFFLLGNSIDEWKDMNHTVANKYRSENIMHLKRMHAQGHEVGVHSFDHTAMPLLSTENVIRQANDTQAAIAAAIGVAPRMFRAPEGKLSPRVLQILTNLNYTVVHWTHDTLDWFYYKSKPHHMLRYIQSSLPLAKDATQGPIILQHDNNAATIKNQAKIIDAIRERNFTLVTLSTCLGEEAYKQVDLKHLNQTKKQNDNGNGDFVRHCTVWDNMTLRLCNLFDSKQPVCNRDCL